MRFKVPQNVDIEDTIVGPLTWKQFLWILGGCGILFVVYQFVEMALFVAIAVIVLGLSAILAFVRPYGQPMIVFLANLGLYLTKNRTYVWKRGKSQFKKHQPKKEKKEMVLVKKQFPEDQVRRLSRVLDTNGKQGFPANPLTSVKQTRPVQSNLPKDFNQRQSIDAPLIRGVVAQPTSNKKNQVGQKQSPQPNAPNAAQPANPNKKPGSDPQQIANKSYNTNQNIDFSALV
ncbi:MAG: hypothetical protein GF332_01565 [Candidatus Moranbacteria bacterium]|nr:hypothetical protein [Candidatus Moranbacteria bacterium]